MDIRELERRVRKLESALRLGRTRSEQDFYENFPVALAPTDGEFSGGSIYFVPLLLHRPMRLRRITMNCYSGVSPTERGARLAIFKPASLGAVSKEQANLLDGRPALVLVRSLGSVNSVDAGLDTQDLNLLEDEDLDPEDRPFLGIWPTATSNFFSVLGEGVAGYVVPWTGNDWPSTPVVVRSSASAPYVLLRSALGVRLYGPVL